MAICHTFVVGVIFAVVLSAEGSSFKDCNFESGLCSWTQDHGSDAFDWTLRRGSTPSAGTGPSSDHTLETGKGSYVYIEASSPRRSGDKARMLSPDIPGGKQCLKFWYHMYGSSMGSLKVYLQGPGTERGNALWTMKGQQGNQWKQAQVSIKTPKDAIYKIVFEGIREGYRGDIALDDITVDTGGC